MPRKAKDVVIAAQDNGSMSVDEWVHRWSGNESQVLESEAATLDRRKLELEKKMKELEEERLKFEDDQKKLKEKQLRAMAYMKMGRPMDMSKVKKKLISFYVPEEGMYEKLQIVKECYFDGLSGYLRHLVEKDLEENFEKYLEFTKRDKTTKGGTVAAD